MKKKWENNCYEIRDFGDRKRAVVFDLRNVPGDRVDIDAKSEINYDAI